MKKNTLLLGVCLLFAVLVSVALYLSYPNAATAGNAVDTDFIHEDVLDDTIPNASFELVTVNGVTVHAGNYRLEINQEISRGNHMLAVDVC